MNQNNTNTTATESTIPFIDNQAIAVVLKIVFAIVMVIILMALSKKIAAFVKKRIIAHTHIGNHDHGEKIAKLISDIVFYILVIFCLFIGFEILGFDVGLIVGGISIGIGLAFKEVLGNMVAGIMLLSTKQINIGDIIEVKDDENFLGRIEEITIRNTVIRTYDMRQVVLPNMTLISKPLKTYSAENIVRLEGDVQVDYETDLSLATQVMTQAINMLSFAQEQDKTKSFVRSFDESGITIRYFFYFDPKKGLLSEYAKGYANEAINNAFLANKISIPFPHRTLVTKEKSHPVSINDIQIKTRKETQQKQRQQEIQHSDLSQQN